MPKISKGNEKEMEMVGGTKPTTDPTEKLQGFRRGKPVSMGVAAR